MTIIQKDQSYTFSKYFELKIESKDLAKEFGYSFARTYLNLPLFMGGLNRILELKQGINEVLPHASLSSETARREILISPIILELVRSTKSEIYIEYLIKVNEQLQGYLDYFLENKKKVLIVEAKKADLDYGMTQLFAELIALDLWEKNEQKPEIIGAVTTGQLWQFARLNRNEKSIEQGLDLYLVPDDLETLMRILIQTLI